MITDSDRFGYQKSAYERPTFPYVCGRASAFGKPCARGPNNDGSCGGVYECRPFRNGDRWECRRPLSAGGPCADGPLPDGTCCQRHPPCKPRPSLRRRRSRIAALVSVFVVALIAAFLHFEPEAFVGNRAAFSSLMPGELSGAHANFALSEKGCTACHAAHGTGVVEWATAFVTSQPLGENCVDCHTFGGSATTAHNAAFEGGTFAADSPSAGVRTDCVMCHTEHKGLDANIAPMKNRQCNSCHQTKIAAFDDGHPEFREHYPHFRRPSIAFDHVKHFATHFPEKLPEGQTMGCVDCHRVEEAARTVPAGSFEKNCASCHLQGIRDRGIRLINVPYMFENPFDAEEVSRVCGPSPDEIDYLRARAAGEEAEEPEIYEYFYEDFGDNLPPVLAMALGVPNDDPDAFTDPIAELYPELAENGVAPLAERVAALPGAPDPDLLLAGLSGELVRRAACAWMQQLEYETPEGVAGGGWSSDGVSVAYKPRGHGDRLAAAWFNYAVNVPAEAEAAGADDAVIEQAETLRDTLLSEFGLGNCTKCHAVTEVTDESAPKEQNAGKLMIEWGYRFVEKRPYLQYDHGPHVNLLGPGTLCTTCHKPNPEANFAASYAQFDATKFEPGFAAVKREACTECHTQGKVRQDCLLCHEYHLEPGFKRSMGFEQAHSPGSDGKEGG